MGTGHFQEFEDEYLETLYEFHEKFQDKDLEMEILQNIWMYPLHQQLKWFRD